MADDADDQDKKKQDDPSSGDDTSDEQKSDDKDSDDKESDGDDGSDDDKTPDDDDDKDKPHAKWPWIVAGVVAVVFLAVILFLVFAPHATVQTEDAYVTAHYANVAPRVSGQIASVHVDDNQPVHAGQLLATLDPRDYQTALDQTLATRASDVARVDQADAQIARQPSLIRQAEAQVQTALARLTLARDNQARYANLADTGAGTVQQHQQADAALREAQAALAQAEAERSSQQHQLDALIADREAAVAQVGRDDAAGEQAKLNLSYTRLYAPIDGTIAQKTVQVGNQVAPGVPLMIVVPLNAVYIMANYRELELRHMRPGQPARIHVDAYNVDLSGYVASVAPASGATFSPIPPNNATGNFTKIVQRLPVKIGVYANQPIAKLLRAGMSVEVWVDTGLENVVEEQANSSDRVTAPGYIGPGYAAPATNQPGHTGP